LPPRQSWRLEQMLANYALDIVLVLIALLSVFAWIYYRGKQ